MCEVLGIKWGKGSTNQIAGQGTESDGQISPGEECGSVSEPGQSGTTARGILWLPQVWEV